MNTFPVTRLRHETSAYLDGLRVVAVALVLIDHAKRTAFTGGFIAELGVFGQEAVAIFFVLSGLLISHSTLRPQRLGDYLVARLSRLWSVVIPAVALTVVLDVAGTMIAPALYAGAGVPPWTWSLVSLWQAVSPILFLNSVPHFGAEVGSNGPFWSLSYEAWYYFAFGALVFLRGWLRGALVLAMAWFVGPSILLLAPIWALGVLVRGQLGRGDESPGAWVVWIGSTVALGLLLLFKYRVMAWIGPFVSPETAANLVERFAVAGLVAVNIVGFDRIGARFAAVRRAIGRPLQAIVDRSFSIYLYQAPLLFFIAALTQHVASRPLRIVLLYAGTISASVALAAVTEQRRGRVAELLRTAGRVLSAPTAKNGRKLRATRS